MEVAPSKSVRCDTNCVMNTQREYSGIPGSIHKKSDWSVQGTQGSLIVTKCPKSSTNVVQDSEVLFNRITASTQYVICIPRERSVTGVL